MITKHLNCNWTTELTSTQLTVTRLRMIHPDSMYAHTGKTYFFNFFLKTYMSIISIMYYRNVECNHIVVCPILSRNKHTYIQHHKGHTVPKQVIMIATSIQVATV